MVAIQIHVHLILSRSIAATCILDTHHVSIVTHVGRSLQVGSERSLLVVSLALIPTLTLELTLKLALW